MQVRFIVMAIVVSAAAGRAAQASSVVLPEPHVSSLENGLPVVVAVRGPIPLVSIRLIIRAGSAFDPPGKAGLADFTARLLRRGTKTLSADALDDAIEFYGGSLEMETTRDHVAIAITAPSEHLGKMLSVLGEMVAAPSFPKDEIEIGKRRVVGQIANDVDDPAVLADRAMMRALFSDHPYGHEEIGNTGAVQAFTRRDVVDFHRLRMGPNVSLLGVVGHISPEEVRREAARALGGWKGGPERAEDPPSPAAPRARVVLVDKPDQSQSQVRFAALGVPRGHPQMYALSLLENALAGGFTSRLMEQVRVNRGLSYSVHCGFERYKQSGIFYISSYTQTETTRALVDVVLSEVGKVRDGGLKPAELSRVKAYLTGLFPMRLETNEALATSMSEMRMYGLPEDFLVRYRDRLMAVTGKEAKAVAQERLFASPPVVVIVGNAGAVESQLKGLGAIERLSLADLK
jgi:zinc protease